MSVLADRIRREFKANDDIRDAGLSTPGDVVRFDDIPYGSCSPLQVLDIYRPKTESDAMLPVIVSVHGGGWVYGDKERYQYYCMSLARRGFAVVNFSYRLAPEHRYPSSMEDTNAVFHWVVDHAAQYRMDAAHVFAVGDSAGAHMLSIYCCICTNPDYASRYAFTPPKCFVPNAVALNCGAYVMDASWDALIAELLPDGGTPEEIELITPLRHITPAFPPTFLMTSTGDFLKSQAPLLASTLTKSNVPFVYHYYGDANTELPHVFHCDIRSEAACVCNDEECDFFRHFL